MLFSCVQVSYVDFCLYEGLEKIETLAPITDPKYAAIQAYLQRIRDLKGVKEYMASARYQKIKTRFNGRQASWGVGDYWVLLRVFTVLDTFTS